MSIKYNLKKIKKLGIMHTIFMYIKIEVITRVYDFP